MDTEPLTGREATLPYTSVEAGKRGNTASKRRLVVCIDGTSNQFSEKVRLTLYTNTHMPALIMNGWG